MSSKSELFHYLAGVGVGLLTPWLLETIGPPTVPPEFVAVIGGGVLAAGIVGVFVTNRSAPEEVAA